MKEWIKLLGWGTVMSVITLAAAFSSSCQITPEGITVLGADYTLPEYQSYQLQDSYHLLLQFNGPVTLKEMHVSTVTDDGTEFKNAAQFTQQQTAEQGACLVTTEVPLVRGTQYVLYGVAEDQKGNSVHFSTVIQGYNETPAQVVLSEIRTTYGNPKSEFVELYVKQKGNLAGMVLDVVYGNKHFCYMLPDVDVETGEYVVLHLRKLSDTCIDETGDNLKSCTHKDACAGRDLWRDDTTKMIGATGIILLYNRAYGDLVDTVLFAESSKDSWNSTALGEAAQTAVSAGLWEGGPGIDGAVCSDGMTLTRTLCRQNIEWIAGQESYPVPSSSGDWFVVGTSQGSPGSANSAIAYE